MTSMMTMALTMMVMVADKKEEEDVAVVDTTNSTINPPEAKVMTETSEEEEMKKKLVTRSDKEIEDVVATQMQEPATELIWRRKCWNKAKEPNFSACEEARSLWLEFTKVNLFNESYL